MRLDAGQVASIRERIRKLERYLQNGLNNLGSLDGTNSFGSTGTMDRLLYEEAKINYQNAKTELYNLEYRLLNAEYILKQNNTNVIDIGSEITVEFLDEDEEYSYILVDELIGKSSIDNYISKDSDFAKSVFGKTRGDNFSYKVKNTGSIIYGNILDVKNKSKHKVHFIKEKPIKYRYSKSMSEISRRKEEKDLLTLYTINQKIVLEQEITRLINLGGSTDNSLKSKLAYYRKILKDYRCVFPIDNGTIGIGSQFSIDLNKKDGSIITKRLELVNIAHSTETTDEFVDRISPLGSMLYGLTENDTFQNNNKMISGKVYDIDNSKDRFNTIDHIEYKKVKSKKQLGC